jgi:hypothetical protein
MGLTLSLTLTLAQGATEDARVAELHGWADR